MKKWMGFFAILCISVSAFAVPDIEFSPGGTSPGNWLYTGAGAGTGVFSFSQMIDIDAIQGATTDALYDEFVYLPSMTLASYTPGMIAGTGIGVLAGGGVVEIKDGLGNTLVKGDLVGGNFVAVFATSVLYPEIAMDILITEVNNTIGSAYLATLSKGMYFDLNLSLQWSKNFDTMIQSGGSGHNGFSGSLTSIIPEPATMILLSLGGLLLRKR
jgi:hypothetical protein